MHSFPVCIEGKGKYYLHVAAEAVGGVGQCADLELLEAHAQDPIARRAAERAEPVPAGEGLAPGLGRHRRARHVLVDLHRLVAALAFR